MKAHGTGTAAGDAAETNTISNIFCKDRERDTDLFVGSVKANIGHTEATSGLAGLIKVVLMLEKGLIPPVPGIETLKDSLNLGSRVKVRQSFETGTMSLTDHF
jgi:acyl transferase domain-containing protein